MSAGMLYACKCVHTLLTGQREREGERERKRARDRERERDVEYIQNCYFYALAPFSYLVFNNFEF